VRPGSGGALEALPMPLGVPGGLWAAAAALRAAAASVGAAPLARSGGRLSSLDGWTGDAAAAAASELGAVAQLEQAVVDRLSRAAAVLTAYGDELDAAQRTVASLQASWTAVLPADPLAPLPDGALAAIAGTYGVVTADLQISAGVAAHRLRSLVAEVVAGGGSGPRGPRVLGWADPPPSDAAVRSTVHAVLPLVSAALAQREASELVDLVVGDLEALAYGDTDAAGRAVARLATRVRDPVVAQTLWSRLDPSESSRLLDAVVGSGSAALTVTLGTALAIAVNPRYTRGLNAVTRDRLDAWREIATCGYSSSGGWFGGARTQGALLTGARQAGLSPGVRYAATVGVAVVAADRSAGTGMLSGGSNARAPSGRVTPSGADGAAGTGPDDPVVDVAQAIEDDGDAVRAWLLGRLPGADQQLVVDHLVAGRYRWIDPHLAAASLRAVGDLVVVAGRSQTDRSAVALDAAFLTAVGQEARNTPEPEAYRVALAPALGRIGAVLARHPDAVTAVLDDSAGLGVDAAVVVDADRLTRPARDPQAWEVVLPDRPTTAALLGALAFDDELRPIATGPVAGSPGTAPALAQVLGSLGQRLEQDLADAVRADHAGDPHALDAAARRLGETVGFTLTSAGEALARRDADTDERNRVVAGLVEWAVGKVAIPGAAGRLATPLVKAAANRLVTATLPTDAESTQRRATAQATETTADAAMVDVRALVSRAEPWGPDQAPQRWAAREGGVPFWDDEGIPLPESSMTTEQRRAFTAWRREVGLTIYDTAPAVVRDGLEAGVRAAARSRS
jgi:hypothetical protein